MANQNWWEAAPLVEQPSSQQQPQANWWEAAPLVEAQQKGDGVALNTTAGLNNALYTMAGAPVDMARGAINLGIRGINAATGADMSTIPSDSFGGSESISGMFGAVGVPEPKNVRAATTGERIARGVGEGVGYTVAPEAAAAGLVRAGAAKIAPIATEMMSNLLGRGNSVRATTANAIAGGTGGGSSVAATEAAPEQWKPLAGLAGGVGGGFAGAAAAVGAGRGFGLAADVASNAAAPLYQAGRERLAGQQIADSASDISQVRSVLFDQPANRIEGSQPTTFQMTGDMGLGGLERSAQTKAPDMFNQRRAEQNTARVAALDGIQPYGAPEKVAEAAKTYIKGIETRSQQAYEAALQRAQASVQNLGAGTNPTETGDAMRFAIEEARKAAKLEEQQLWSAVDPDGSLALPANNARKHVAETFGAMPMSAKPIAGEEAALYDVLSQYKDVMPFSEISALQSRVKSALREERLANGESPAYRRLSQLNGAVEADIQAAVAGKMDQQAQAVARGEMSYDDTLMANYLRKQQAWYDERQAVAGDTSGFAGSGGNAGAGSPTISGVFGTGSKAGGGFGQPPSNPGLPGTPLSPNFDAAAAGRLGEARNSTLDIANRFDNKTLGPIRKRPSSVSQYDMSSASVPGRVFYPGAKSADAIRDYRAAVGDQTALAQLESYAVDRIRKDAMRPDGSLDPAKVESFRRGHADALRAFPELDRKLTFAAQDSTRLKQTATRNEDVLLKVIRSRIAKAAGLDSPADIARTIGGAFDRQDAVKEMGRIRRAMGSDPEAQDGLRKAVVDHIKTRFIGNTEAGTSGQSLMKSDQFQTFVRSNREALQAGGFSPDHVKVLEGIAADLQQANRSLTAVKLPGGSNTAQDAFAVSKGDGAGTVLGKLAVAAAAGAGSTFGGGLGAMASVVGTQAASAMRNLGIQSVDDLVTDAMLNPDRARVLLSKLDGGEPPAKLMDAIAEVYTRAASPSISPLITDPSRETAGQGPKRDILLEALVKSMGKDAAAKQAESPAYYDIVRSLAAGSQPRQ